MKSTLIIYYDKEKTVRQVVRPTKSFFEGMRVVVGDEEKTKRIEASCWRGLVEGVTMSNHEIGFRCYHSYEVK